MERITVFDGKFWAHKNFPPVKDDTVDEFVDCVKELAARLAAYEETGLEPEAVEHLKLASMGKAIAKIKEFEGVPVNRLRELAQAEKTGQLAEFPFIAMVEQSLRDGTMKPMSDQKHNGRYAVVYKSERWTFPLIDICGTPYNTEQAVERMREISREAAEAALKEREAEHDG